MRPETNAKICEKLNIEPVAHTCRCGHDLIWHNLIGTGGCSECDDWQNPHPCGGYEAVHIAYPDLATEAGFFILWAALKRNGWSTCAVDDGKDCWAKLSRPGAEVRSGYYDTAPQALLMAAALALGVADE